MASLLELAITCRMNLGLASGDHILRRHISDGAVQSHGVVVIHVGLNQALGIFPGKRRARPNAFRL